MTFRMGTLKVGNNTFLCLSLARESMSNFIDQKGVRISRIFERT